MQKPKYKIRDIVIIRKILPPEWHLDWKKQEIAYVQTKITDAKFYRGSWKYKCDSSDQLVLLEKDLI